MKFLEVDENRDFPFYRHNPRISKSGWFVLLLSVLVAYSVYILSSLVPGTEIIASILFVVIMLLPLLYFSKWDYSLMFKKLTKNEIILAILMFIGYMVYALIVSYILMQMGLEGATESSIQTTSRSIEGVIELIFSLMGEELLKFIPLMFMLRVLFKYTSNLKMSLVISSILIMIGFGLLHYDPPSKTLASVLLLQGLGTIFELYGYFKTKNVFVPYISHLLTDLTVMVFSTVG